MTEVNTLNLMNFIFSWNAEFQVIFFLIANANVMIIRGGKMFTKIINIHEYIIHSEIICLVDLYIIQTDFQVASTNIYLWPECFELAIFLETKACQLTSNIMAENFSCKTCFTCFKSFSSSTLKTHAHAF